LFLIWVFVVINGKCSAVDEVPNRKALDEEVPGAEILATRPVIWPFSTSADTANEAAMLPFTYITPAAATTKAMPAAST
jgi:hypothetical protein